VAKPIEFKKTQNVKKTQTIGLRTDLIDFKPN